MIAAGALFARHVDLAPLGTRRRGVVRCIFHADRTPSLSLDLEAGVFHCFGCGTQGGVKRFAELVGERQPEAPKPRRWESPLQQMRREAVRLARSQPWAREGVLELYAAADALRGGYHRVDAMCRRALDSEDGWEILARANQLQTACFDAEAEVDAILRERPRW